jgi:hypothetical protein
MVYFLAFKDKRVRHDYYLDEEETIKVPEGIISVIPAWKLFLEG